MSTQERRVHNLRCPRNHQRRKTLLNVDLNATPAYESREQEGTSTHPGPLNVQAGQQGSNVPPATIDLEAMDDDVIISSPRAFAEARNNSRRNHGRAIVVELDSEDRSSRNSANSRDKRRRVSENQTFINCDLYVHLEGSSKGVSGDIPSVVAPPPLPPPPPKEPTFNCPVCMGPLVEEMSTKCGHIFCKACIKAAIAAQGKCPTCRRKITMKDTIRIYLPATN